MNYSYRAIDKQGKISTGEITAREITQVAGLLNQKGLITLDITPEKSGLAVILNKEIFAGQTLPLKDLLTMTRELATLVGAGLTLVKSLSVLSSMSNNKRLDVIIKRLLKDIREGDSFQTALSKEKNEFPQFYVSMIGAGEVSGKLADVLGHLSDYLARSYDIREKIKSSLVYPAILLLMVVFAMVLIVTVVLPQFEPIFAQAEGKLPWITKLVIGFSDVVNSYGFLMLGMFALTLLGGVATYRHRDIRAKVHQKLLNVYILGNLIKKSEFARFHRMLGTLIGNGLSLVPAFAIASDGIGNIHIKNAIHAILNRVKEGANLSGEYRGTDFVPPIAMELTRVGEDTGRLSEMMIRSADIMEKEVGNLTDKFMALLVPGLTIFMGVIIAGMIASVLLGIMSINEIAF